MFETVSDDSKRECLHSSFSFVLRCTVREDARQSKDLSEPPAVGFLLKLN